MSDEAFEKWAEENAHRRKTGLMDDWHQCWREAARQAEARSQAQVAQLGEALRKAPTPFRVDLWSYCAWFNGERKAALATLEEGK